MSAHYLTPSVQGGFAGIDKVPHYDAAKIHVFQITSNYQSKKVDYSQFFFLELLSISRKNSTFVTIKYGNMDCSEMLSEEFQYELIDMSWSLKYDFRQMPHATHVADEGEMPEPINTQDEIEYDEDGIPMI